MRRAEAGGARTCISRLPAPQRGAQLLPRQRCQLGGGLQLVLRVTLAQQGWVQAGQVLLQSPEWVAAVKWASVWHGQRELGGLAEDAETSTNQWCTCTWCCLA